MKKIYLGKITSFHGVKGEIRIHSSFEFKEKAFCVGTHLIISEKEYLIKSYRRHKNYEMVTLDGFNSLNDVLFLKGQSVYKNESELKLSEKEVLDSELLTYQVLTNVGKRGKIKEIFFASPKNKVLRVLIGEKEYLIPYQDQFVKVNKAKKEVEINWIEW